MARRVRKRQLEEAMFLGVDCVGLVVHRLGYAAQNRAGRVR
jgi:hypothetical protein